MDTVANQKIYQPAILNVRVRDHQGCGSADFAGAKNLPSSSAGGCRRKPKCRGRQDVESDKSYGVKHSQLRL